ncbi:nucleotidyltransferase domain-containing protein [Streptomyces niveus]|uniref:nucleotidyltransferase domain-containing protein n=1 Tax=Streptomyces niveus TaxID=193462 RepID=UPI003419F015
MMRAEDVLAVLDLLDRAGIEVWLDGGWGVDALLCEQTRPHEDLDIVVRAEALADYARTMRENGFRLWRDDGPYNQVLVDDAGRLVDVHAVDLGVTRTDVRGVEVYGPGGLPYPVGSLTGSGRVRGRRVDCGTARFQVASHTGYAIDEDDERDVLALHHRFGVPLAARVRAWHEDDGWGVLDAANLREDVWAHFSAVAGDDYAEPAVGQAVTFSLEQEAEESEEAAGTARQGGYRRRAMTVWPEGAALSTVTWS